LPGADPIRGAVPREHLVEKLDRVSTARLRLVIGPAGSGKTILLRQLAAHTATRPGLVNVWCTANAAEVSATSFVHKLAGCLAAALGPHTARITHLDTLVARLAGSELEFVVYIDDAHRWTGRPSANTLAQLLQAAPPNVRFVIASRNERVPATTQLPDASPVYRMDYRDLRFRTWDVERLFRDYYRSPLQPEAAAALCAHVEGWPIALRLFHVDTAMLSDHERADAARAPLAGSGRIRTYLEKEVLGTLPADVRDFMVDASVLGVLEGNLCDTALDRTGSGELLHKLADHHVLTFDACPTAGSFRFHLLLQRFLEQRLAEVRGPHLTRQAYHHAAARLVSFGHWAEAYRCYAHAEDWVASGAVLHRFSAHHDGLLASASVPSELLADDPWIALAEARRLRGEGRLAEAYDGYLSAEDHLPDPRLRWQCSLERSGIARWINRDDGPNRGGDPLVDDLSGYLLDAVRGHPAKLLTRSVPATNPEWVLGRAIAAMLDGRVDLAMELVEPLASSSNPFLSLASKIMTAVLDATGYSRGTAARFGALALQSEAAGWLWLARIARGATAVVHADGCADAQAVLEQCREVGDEWGALLIGYLLAVGCLRAGRDSRPALHETIDRARQLGARVSETWLQVLLVDELERRGDPRAAAERTQLEWLLENTVLERASTHAGEMLTAVRFPVPSPPGLRLADEVIEPDPPVQIRCFGRYELLVDGKEIDLGELRAQARRVLRVLSMCFGQPMHEERLIAALWPDAPLKQAKHRLQVAISSLRALLRKHLPDGRDDLGVVRHGNAYLLRLPAGSTVDVIEFAEALRDWRNGRGSRGQEQVASLGHRVLDLYRGELLSEEGPVEWVLARRESVRGEAAGVAATLARLELERGNASSAIEVCERALTIDELDGQLWTLLAEARRRTGNVAAARRTQQAYLDLVADAP